MDKDLIFDATDDERTLLVPTGEKLGEYFGYLQIGSREDAKGIPLAGIFRVIFVNCETNQVLSNPALDEVDSTSNR